MFMSAGSSAGLLSLACVVRNESSVNINSLLTRYSFAEAADELKLRGEIALWRQRWIRLKMAFDDVVPETARGFYPYSGRARLRPVENRGEGFFMIHFTFT